MNKMSNVCINDSGERERQMPIFGTDRCQGVCRYFSMKMKLVYEYDDGYGNNHSKQFIFE